MARSTSIPNLDGSLDRWVAEGLLTAEQAARIREREALPALPVPPTRRQPLLTEALAYLGGVLILVAAVVIVARYWQDTSVAVRLGLAAAAAAVLLAAGAAVPRWLDEAGVRLRAVLWLLSSVAFAFFLGVTGSDAFGWEDGDDVALLVGGGSALYAAALWARGRTVVQQGVLLVALAVTAAAGAVHVEGADSALPGLAVWGVGLCWGALARAGLLLGPRRPAYVLAAAAALLGAEVTMGENWGSVLALVTVAALVVTAVRLGDLVLLGLGALGALTVLPAAMSRFFPGALAAPLGLLVAGVLLVAAALRAMRRPRAGQT